MHAYVDIDVGVDESGKPRLTRWNIHEPHIYKDLIDQ